MAYFCSKKVKMKHAALKIILTFIIVLVSTSLMAQCSICTKTAQQLGEKTGTGLNYAILYLAAFPLTALGVIGYKWWKRNQEE